MITIAFITSRAVPRWEWFIESLCAQTTADQRANLQVVFVDGLLWGDLDGPWNRDEVPLGNPMLHDLSRWRSVDVLVRRRFDHLHIPPLPCAWQGPFRQTNRDFFCASNARNTAFVVARHPYVAFVDDLSVLAPTWFDQVKYAAYGEYVVCGAYKKVKKLNVVSGRIESFEPFPAGVDSRWDRGSDDGVVPWNGAALYGCSFGIPLEAALEIDGFDGIGNGAGFEDCDFGIRVERAGWAVFYNRNMLTLESEEEHHIGGAPAKYRKIVTPDRLPKDYQGETWSDHVAINRVIRETDRTLPIIGDNLRVVRARYQSIGLVPVPREPLVDWRDGQLLSEL